MIETGEAVGAFDSPDKPKIERPELKHTPEQLEAILIKDGKDWTPEESRIVGAAIKKNRQAVKVIRKKLRHDS